MTRISRLVSKAYKLRTTKGIKPIRPGVSYPGNHPHCRLGASYPRALSWNIEGLPRATIQSTFFV
ncbi:hypothetical protein YC2023_088809 [Brassica napus]